MSGASAQENPEGNAADPLIQPRIPEIAPFRPRKLADETTVEDNGAEPATALALSIVIPVRNESLNLSVMLKLLRAVVDVPYEILVVYDSPDDDSIAVIEEVSKTWSGVRGILNTKGRGVIYALNSGVEAAHGDYVLIFAADEVGPLLAIDDMLELANEGCDFITCTRYAHGGRRLGGSRIGHTLSWMANKLFQTVAGCVMTDATTGIKMFKRDVYPRFELSARPVGWAVAFEMGIKAQAIGLTIGEVPIISIDRLFGGKSTFRLGSWVVEYSRWFWWGLKELRRSGTNTGAKRPMVKTPSLSVDVR